MNNRFLPAVLCTALAATMATTTLVACSESSDDAGSTETSVSTSVAQGIFPVTVTNAFGTATVTEKPQRVVTLGWSDQAVATELGADVIMAPQTYSSFSGGDSGSGDSDRMLPYLHPDAEPAWFNPMSLDVEAVADQKPDIILATSAFTLDQATYDKLAAIAPVVSYEHQLYEASPEDNARRIGQALGEQEKAEELIDTAHRSVEDLKKDLPGLDGKSYVYGQYRGAVVSAVTAADNATARFMSTLGIIPAPKVADIDAEGKTPGTVDLSMENIDLVDSADLLFMTYQGDTDRKAFEDSPAVKRLAVIADRYRALDKETATALQDPNIVSVPWLIAQLRPSLETVGR